MIYLKMNDNEKINLLCLSFRTPPALRPQAILIDKMVHQWLADGLKPVIITQENGHWDIDATVYKIPRFQMNKYLARIPGVYNFFEDRYFYRMSLIVSAIIKKHNLNIAFSFSNPQTSNILGALLKRKLGIKFISHFSDPWYDSPLQDFSRFSKRRVLHQERFIVENSDRIIFVNSQLRDLIMKKYPILFKNRTSIIPHCFDRKDYPEVQKSKSGVFIFSHIGTFYKQRTPEILFKIFERLLMKDKTLASKVRLQLIGGVRGYTISGYTDFNQKNMDELVEKFSYREILELIPAVDYKKSLKYMKLADCLIVIDANIPGSPFLTSKVVDYAGSGTEIVGITPDGSPTVEFLSNLGYHTFNYEQIEEISDYFLKLISGQIKTQINRDYLKQFEVSATADKLINNFKEVLGQI